MVNREIKFRVWNGAQMVYDITSGKFGTFYVNPENGDGLNPQDTACLSTNTTKYFETTLVMQYVGIKDKNNKAIYEGDLVEDNDGDVYLVKWECADCDWNGDYHQAGYCFPKNSKIIGNIYENPKIKYINND